MPLRPARGCRCSVGRPCGRRRRAGSSRRDRPGRAGRRCAGLTRVVHARRGARGGRASRRPAGRSWVRTFRWARYARRRQSWPRQLASGDRARRKPRQGVVGWIRPGTEDDLVGEQGVLREVLMAAQSPSEAGLGPPALLRGRGRDFPAAPYHVRATIRQTPPGWLLGSDGPSFHTRPLRTSTFGHRHPETSTRGGSHPARLDLVRRSGLR